MGAGGAMTLPFIPWNTLGALKDKMTGHARQDEFGQSAVADTGRALGGALGAGTVKGLAENWHVPRTSPLANAAMILGGMGVGSFLGHRQGVQIGQDIFPGSLGDRLKRDINNFQI